jgi:hypothetical protein
MGHQIYQLPAAVLFSGGVLAPGWYVEFYATGTTTPVDVYTTSALNVAHDWPVEAGADGVLPVIYLNSQVAYKTLVYDQNDVIQPGYGADPVNDSVLSQSIIGALLYPLSTAEIAAGVTPTNYTIPSHDVIGRADPRRYGAIGDNSTDCTAAYEDAIAVATVARCPVLIPVGEYRNTGLTLSSGSYIPPFIGMDMGGPNARRVSALIYVGTAGGKHITVTGLGSAVVPTFKDFTLHGGGNADWGIYCTDQRGGIVDNVHFEEYARVANSCCVELRNTNGGGDNTEQWSITNSNFLNYRTGIRISNEVGATFPSHAYGYYNGNVFAAQNLNSQDLDIGGPNSNSTDGVGGFIRCYWQARTHVSGNGGRHIRVRDGSSIYQCQMFASGESDNGGANTPYYRIEANGGHGNIAFMGSLDIVEAGLPAGNVMTDNINNPANFFPCELFSSGWAGSAGRTNRISGNLSLTAGGLKVAEGSNARQGLAVLVGGTVTVANTSVTANSRILVTSNVDGGTPGWLRVSARVNATSFTITSSSGTDTSSVAWEIFEPA